METIRIEILNPKAKKLINDLADLKLINIKRSKVKSEFRDLLVEMRKNSDSAPSLEEIQKEVDKVREEKHVK